jgi:hypothetical protein
MQARHAIGVTMILAIAVFLGAFAGFRSAALSSQARGATVVKSGATSATIRAHAHQLGRVRASLRRLARSRPPRLPKVPHFALVAKPRTPAPAMVAAPPRAAPPPAAAPAVASPAPQRVVYVRPRHVVVIHRHHGDHEGGEGGGDD